MHVITMPAVVMPSEEPVEAHRIGPAMMQIKKSANTNFGEVKNPIVFLTCTFFRTHHSSAVYVGTTST